MARQVDGLALGVIAAGGLAVYAGLKGYSIPHALQAVIKGQPPSTGGPANPITGATINTAGQNNIGAGAQGGTPAKNQAIAKLLAAKYGWNTGPEWDALVTLWNSESGWDNTIWNISASCGNDAYAYGIPQFCGHGPGGHNTGGHGSVCPFPAGNPGNPPECGGTSDAAAQINAGLAYIHDNYGSPTQTPLGGY